jgi:peptide chain release factor 3
MLSFSGIPVFAPEHFVRVDLKDPLKSKQLNKALNQLSEEGAVQVFRPVVSNDQFLGVVGVLQFDVVKFRIEHEYGVKVAFSGLPYKAARWIGGAKKDVEDFVQKNGQHICRDQHEMPTILLSDEWRIKLLKEKFPDIEFLSTSENIGSK